MKRYIPHFCAVILLLIASCSSEPKKLPILGNFNTEVILDTKFVSFCSVNAPLASKVDFDKVNQDLEEKVDQIMNDLAV